MFSLRKPQSETLRRIIAEQAAKEFTYTHAGATATNGPMPARYHVDHTRALLGSGRPVFERARAGLMAWEQFHLNWLELFPTDAPLRPGETVVVVAHAFGLWSVNAARIVYRIDEPNSTSAARGQPVRFGFAYGTLPGHVESGEERFLIEWDHETDQVWFDILAFSRPRHLFTRLAYPCARAMQKRFAAHSAAAMQRFCSAQS